MAAAAAGELTARQAGKNKLTVGDVTPHLILRDHQILGNSLLLLLVGHLGSVFLSPIGRRQPQFLTVRLGSVRLRSAFPAAATRTLKLFPLQ